MKSGSNYQTAFLRVFVLLALSLVLCPFSSTAEAQTVAKIPNFVLKDGGGNVVGIVVGFQKLGEVSLAMDDPDFSNDVPIQITVNNGFQFDGPDNVYYSGAGCTGIAYLIHVDSSSRAMSKFLGRNYGVGPTPGTWNTASEDVIVYRGQAAVAGPQPTIQSRFSGNTCIGVGLPGGALAAVADEIIDITTDFGDPATWTME